ncbi:BnaCnng15720D [Brassica napus]|uniref:BnaCnng15720D protein n=1 Tax=Brassica napus TaxID=3708 RepID=A0A078IB83_BRANA|nr:BnaCnng15720D [Brassica napus]
MLQFPTLMSQFPSSTKTIPADEILLAMEEAELEEKCNEIRKMSPSLPVIGKPVVENQQEEDDDEADDDHDADNGEESDGE